MLFLLILASFSAPLRVTLWWFMRVFCCTRLLPWLRHLWLSLLHTAFSCDLAFVHPLWFLTMQCVCDWARAEEYMINLLFADSEVVPNRRGRQVEWIVRGRLVRRAACMSVFFLL
jgi:hypothetical protein